MTNVLTSLNAGSGLDLRTLVGALIDAERAPRIERLDARQAQVEARISALGQFRAALDALVGALDRRASGGALSGQPRVSDPTILGLVVDAGTTLPRQSVEVRQLAQAQTLGSLPVGDPDVPLGEGSLLIRFGTVAPSGPDAGFDPSGRPDLIIPVPAAQSGLTGIARAINDAAAQAGAPLQAQLVQDADGTRLLLRGTSGEASGFLVEPQGDPGLAMLAFAPGASTLARTQAAADARIALDGLEIRRPTNIVTDLLPGARLTLARAAPGAPVSIEAQRDSAELAAAARDLAGALDELQALGTTLASARPGAAAGALTADSATRRALDGLARLNFALVSGPPGDGPRTLFDIGISRDRTGRFTIDETRLQRAVARDPAGVASVIAGMTRRGEGGQPPGPLAAIAATFRTASGGRPGEPTALVREQAAIARERAQIDARSDRQRLLLTRQFASLDNAVGQSRALGAYLDQQIALWTRRTDR
jgi:flagellar hook-associated protein 2